MTPSGQIAAARVELDRAFGSCQDWVVLWRRFTPRLLQQLITGTLHKDGSLMARKFLSARWLGRPEEERDAVMRAGGRFERRTTG
jgi:hypothetical protein